MFWIDTNQFHRPRSLVKRQANTLDGPPHGGLAEGIIKKYQRYVIIGLFTRIALDDGDGRHPSTDTLCILLRNSYTGRLALNPNTSRDCHMPREHTKASATPAPDIHEHLLRAKSNFFLDILQSRIVDEVVALVIRKSRITIIRDRIDIISKTPGSLNEVQQLPLRSASNLANKFLKLEIANDVLNDSAHLTFFKSDQSNKAAQHPGFCG